MPGRCSVTVALSRDTLGYAAKSFSLYKETPLIGVVAQILDLYGGACPAALFF